MSTSTRTRPESAIDLWDDDAIRYRELRDTAAAVWLTGHGMCVLTPGRRRQGGAQALAPVLLRAPRDDERADERFELGEREALVNDVLSGLSRLEVSVA